MIIEKLRKVYSVKCDRCCCIYHDVYLNTEMWTDDGQALENALLNGGWVEDGNEHYCPQCAEYIRKMEAKKI